MSDDKPTDADDAKAEATAWLSANMCEISMLSGVLAAEIDPKDCPRPDTLIMTSLLNAALLDHLTAKEPDRKQFLESATATLEALWDAVAVKFEDESMVDHLSSHLHAAYIRRSHEIQLTQSVAAMMNVGEPEPDPQEEPEPDPQDVN